MADLLVRDPFRNFFRDFGRETNPFVAFAEERLAESRNALRVRKTVTDGVAKLETDLPGVKKEDLGVKLEELRGGGTLVRVSGKRGEAEFGFTITLSTELDASAAKAELVDGVLTLSAPVLDSRARTVTELTVA